ncbi:MAG TPA: hypothetical protein VFN72_04375 [Solirubrobacterales bacterium]|nr:hypothetical protein [Solirubrobacterales bacterium]
MAIATALVAAGTAQAAMVTVGSPIASIGSGGVVAPNGSTETVANTALPEAGAHITSPVNGTIVSWRLVSSSATGDSYALRVLRPQSNGTYEGVGSAPVSNVIGDQTFSASLPIQAGDLIGVDMANNGGGIRATLTPTVGAAWDGWVPAVPESGFAAPNPIIHETDQELAFNVVVQYPDPVATPPSGSPAAKSKCKKKKKHKRSAESAKKKCKKKKKR